MLRNWPGTRMRGANRHRPVDLVDLAGLEHISEAAPQKQDDCAIINRARCFLVDTVHQTRAMLTIRQRAEHAINVTPALACTALNRNPLQVC